LAAACHHPEALALYEEALAIARRIAAGHPADQSATRMVAEILYAMGEALVANGSPDVAAGVLAESETICRDLDRRGAPAPSLLADVHAAKGSAELARGHGATAVLELDTAVIIYIDLHTGVGDPYLLDLARVLALNASALRAYGDPDVAVASADAAVGFYRSRLAALSGTPDAARHNRYLRLAAGIAADIHAAHGRLDAALDADDVAVIAARAVATAAGLAQASRDQANRELAIALTRTGAHLRVLGRYGEAESLVEEGCRIDSAGAAFALAGWERVSAGVVPMTLARALDAAVEVLGAGQVPPVLLEALVGPAADRAVLVPSSRCSPQVSPGFAALLAGIAVQLLPSAAAAGVRIGLEAHYLFAVSSREQSTPMRHSYREFGFHWTLVLLVCSRHYAGANDLPMALDLAGWADAAAMGLVPFLAGAPALATLVRECLTNRADLYVRSGDLEAGAEVLRVVRSLEEHGSP
jgi:tetratricopeptide (TPR) repeat protein